MLEILDKALCLSGQMILEPAVLVNRTSTAVQGRDGASCNPIRPMWIVKAPGHRTKTLGSDGCVCLSAARLPKGACL